MIAICSMIRKPFNFDFWLDYHISIGVDYFLFRIEETPELRPLLEKYKDRVIVEYIDVVDKTDNYWTIIDRQRLFMDESLLVAESLGVDWLFHIDNDELIWTKYNRLSEFTDRIEEKFDTVSINNYEAVYPSDSLDNPFLQTNKFFRCKFGGCGAYIQGKSAGRPNREIENHGPHYFTGETFWSSPSEALILHFESPTFEIWYSKFDKSDRANVKNQSIEETFKSEAHFYRRSINAVCNSSKEEARKFYNECKVKPYYESDSLAKLFWTPQLPQKNSQWSK